MTVTYTSSVADCKGFGCFWKLLFRWRGSVYKLVWPDLLAYTFFYFLLSIIYRFGLSEDGKRLFEQISIYTQYYTELIPISFVLGFYVSIVVQRWWAQYENLPWPDALSLYTSTSIPGNDDRGRMMRRTIVRYANLAFTLTLIMISPRIKKRFPTLDHLVEAGLLTTNEKKIFEDMNSKTAHPMYWMPLVWSGTVVARARKEGKIRDDFAVKTIIDEINRLRGLCGMLLSYDWISIPLVYTQVVTLAVYTFFLATLMGRQFLDPEMNYDKHSIDMVFPIFTYLQFFFYMGWLKVAESLVNPFGEDDDDFEINWLIDRNLQVSYLIVDEMHNEHPELIQDIYWDEVFPSELPYTIAAQEFRTEPPQGSTANIEIPAEEQELLPILEEENYESQLENGINIPRSASGMKRIGSNLSNIFHQPSTFLSKSSVFSFLHRSSSSVRRPSHRKSIHRIASRSSGVTLSPQPTNRTDSHIYQMSDLSLSGSESFMQDSHPLHSSKESVSTDTFSGRRKYGRRKSGNDDEGIHFNIKKRDKDDHSTDRERHPSVNFENDIPHGTPVERTLSRIKKERTLSSSSYTSQNNPERPKTVEIRDPPHTSSAAPKLIDILKPSRTRNPSSSSLKEHFGRKPNYKQPKFGQLPRPSSFSVPSRPSDFPTRRHYPRGPILRGLSSTLEKEEPELLSTTPPASPSESPNQQKPSKDPSNKGMATKMPGVPSEKRKISPVIEAEDETVRSALKEAINPTSETINESESDPKVCQINPDAETLAQEKDNLLPQETFEETQETGDKSTTIWI